MSGVDKFAISDSLYSRFVQVSRHRDTVEALHGGHRGLHGLLLPQVRRPDVVRQQVAVVLQPSLGTGREMKA